VSRKRVQVGFAMLDDRARSMAQSASYTVSIGNGL